MYKIVIINGKTVSVEEMLKSFPWEKWDCQVVVTAIDQEEAVKTVVENLKRKEHTLSETGKEEHLNDVNSFIVKKAVKYIEEYYSDGLTLREVAEHTYVSQWHLSRLLNKHLGCGFSEFLNANRIKRAKELLKDQSLRVSDVAEIVGFHNISHFSRVFKKVVGVSPNEYRNGLQ